MPSFANPGANKKVIRIALPAKIEFSTGEISKITADILVKDPKRPVIANSLIASESIFWANQPIKKLPIKLTDIKAQNSELTSRSIPQRSEAPTAPPTATAATCLIDMGCTG